jgi:glycosyltransferase involved in cell wall biosynthesis
MKASIVIPAHNEESTIKNTLEDLKNIGETEIIVVCNGCTDGTLEEAKKVNLPNIKCLNIAEPNKGTAIIEGLKYANSSVIGFVDADGSFESKHVERLINEVNGSDCVIASKWKDKPFSSVNWPLKRKISGRIWNFFVNLLLDLGISDTQAGAKFMKKSAFNSIDKEFISGGWEMDVELLYKIKKKGYKIKEIYTPIKPIKRISTFNMIKAPGMFINLLKIWFRA